MYTIEGKEFNGNPADFLTYLKEEDTGMTTKFYSDNYL